MPDNIYHLPTSLPPAAFAASTYIKCPQSHLESMDFAFEHINAAMQAIQDAAIAAPTHELTSQISACLALAGTLSIMVGKLGSVE